LTNDYKRVNFTEHPNIKEDISQGTGPALRVTQFGEGIDNPVAKFNIGREEPALLLVVWNFPPHHPKNDKKIF
jgi:hypothetical protein